MNINIRSHGVIVMITALWSKSCENVLRFGRTAKSVGALVSLRFCFTVLEFSSHATFQSFNNERGHNTMHSLAQCSTNEDKGAEQEWIVWAATFKRSFVTGRSYSTSFFLFLSFSESGTHCKQCSDTICVVFIVSLFWQANQGHSAPVLLQCNCSSSDRPWLRTNACTISEKY